MFIAGFNMPGYLPESDPAEFDDFEDAQSFIVDELERVEDFIDAGGSDNEEAEEECYDARNEAEGWKDTPREKYWMVFCDGYVYWIERQ